MIGRVKHMNESSRLKLQSILSSLDHEAEPIAKELENCHIEINKIEKTIQSLTKDYTEDEFVFSPRTARFQNDEVHNYELRLTALQEEADILQDRYDQINHYIDTLVDVLSSDVDSGNVKNALVYQEKDRQRIALELHDTALQNMTSLVEKLDTCRDDIDTDPVKAKMELSLASRSLNDSIDEIRSVIYNLRPVGIDSQDFQSILNELIDSFNDNNQYDVSREIDEINCDDHLLLVTIYRIIEECFMNIKKHADAYRIHFIFQEQVGKFYIYIEDDGKGFDVNKTFINDKPQFGLSLMKERVEILGGNISIDSSANAGTKIKILIPSLR